MAHIAWWMLSWPNSAQAMQRAMQPLKHRLKRRVTQPTKRRVTALRRYL